MRDYTKVSPALWLSKRFNTLPSDDARYLMVYLLTNRHQNSAGAYELPEGYASSDLRWNAKRYRAALEELRIADMVRLDPENEIVVINRWFRHNPPMNGNHMLGIERLLHRLPCSNIAAEALEAAQQAWQDICAERQKTRQKEPPGAENSVRPPRSDWVNWRPRAP